MPKLTSWRGARNAARNERVQLAAANSGCLIANGVSFPNQLDRFGMIDGRFLLLGGGRAWNRRNNRRAPRQRRAVATDQQRGLLCCPARRLSDPAAHAGSHEPGELADVNRPVEICVGSAFEPLRDEVAKHRTLQRSGEMRPLARGMGAEHPQRLIAALLDKFDESRGKIIVE